MQSQQAGLVLQAFIGKHTKLKSAMNQNRTKTKTKPKNNIRAEDAGGNAIV